MNGRAAIKTCRVCGWKYGRGHTCRQAVPDVRSTVPPAPFLKKGSRG